MTIKSDPLTQREKQMLVLVMLGRVRWDRSHQTGSILFANLSFWHGDTNVTKEVGRLLDQEFVNVHTDGRITLSPAGSRYLDHC